MSKPRRRCGSSAPNKENIMSQFQVVATKIHSVKNHPDADRLDIVTVKGYTSIVSRGKFEEGQIVIYLPEASILPDYLIKSIGLKLSGANFNRICALQLRGVFSQGICIGKSVEGGVEVSNEKGEIRTFTEGEDASEFLGVKKYEPQIPIEMQGKVVYAGTELTVSFDIEDIKSFPDEIKEGDNVVLTEKIHGTFTGIGVVPEKDANKDFLQSRIVVFSKGLEKGLVFQGNENNLYMRTAKHFSQRMLDMFGNEQEPVFILGETFGKVQDLNYGIQTTEFTAFALVRGYRYTQRYESDENLEKVLSILGIKRVPVFYRGPFSKEILSQVTNGYETVSGKHLHVREGVVITRDDGLMLKSVSENYLMRGGKNTTEFN